MGRRLISLVLVLAFVCSAVAQFTHHLTHLGHTPAPTAHAATHDHHGCGHAHACDSDAAEHDQSPAEGNHDDHESCDLCDLIATLAPLDTAPTVVAPPLERVAVVASDLPDAAAAPVVGRERNRGPPVLG